MDGNATSPSGADPGTDARRPPDGGIGEPRSPAATTPSDPDALAVRLGSGVDHAVFEGLGDLVIVLGPNLEVEYANPVCIDILGWSPAEIVGRSIADLVHPEDLVRSATAVRRAAVGQTTPAVPGAFRLRHVDGSWRHLELNAGRTGSAVAPRTVVIGRLNQDPAIYDRLLALLTAQAPTREAVELLPSFATWRQPKLPFAVAYDGSGLAREVVGDEAAVELLRSLVAAGPWAPDHPHGVPVRGNVADLPAAALVVAAGHGVSQWVAVSRPSPDGRTGALVVGWTTPNGPDIGAVERPVLLMARALDLVLGWREQRAALEWAARTDALTGLPDRPTLLGELDLALRRARGAPVGLLHIDIQGIREVNQRLGSEAGDQVLSEVAARIATLARAGDLVARLGGCRLAMICSGLDAPVAAEAVAHQVVAAMAEPVHVDGRPVHVQARVGLALTAHHQSSDVGADGLVLRAERAVEVARGAEGAPVVVSPGVGGFGPAGPGDD